MSSIMNIVKCGSSEEAKTRLAKVVQDSYDAHTGAIFSVGLSGGSLPTILGEVLPTITTDWQKWKFFFCDERLVPFDDSESTFGAYKRAMVSKMPQLSLNQFVIIDPSLNASDSADDYISKMRQWFETEKWPRFDLLFLGMGPDGHTCSLFPDHPLLKETNEWVAFIGDSPKPPPNRITLTLPVLNNAKCCLFYTTGESKAHALNQIVVQNKALPAGLVRPTNGRLYWIVDADAAQLIPQQFLSTIV